MAPALEALVLLVDVCLAAAQTWEPLAYQQPHPAVFDKDPLGPNQQRDSSLDKPGQWQLGAFEDYDTSTLRLLHVVFRHGERTPADTYPKDPHVNNDFAPVGWGQLTNRGKRQQYEQGKWLRQRYGKFLGDFYHPDIVHVQSTDVDRAKMSAMLEMAGMWPPTPAQQWSDELRDWQPIPVNSQPLDQDSLLLVRVPCGRYGEALDEVIKSPEVLAVLEEWRPLMKMLTERTGMKIDTPDDVQSLYSTLKAEEGFNLTLPSWTREVYPHELEYITAVSFVLNALTPELQKIKGGPLLKQILVHSLDKAANSLKPDRRKLFVYAGHDSTISNLLSALKVWDLQIPNYGILAMFELHEHPMTHEYGLKVFLRNSTETPPYPLTIPNCDHFCPLEKVVKLVESVIPGDLGEVCKAKNPDYKPPPPSGP